MKKYLTTNTNAHKIPNMRTIPNVPIEDREQLQEGVDDPSDVGLIVISLSLALIIYAVLYFYKK